MKVTLNEVAKRAGVSRAAASFVLNKRDRELRIADRTRTRILQAAAELNYTPNHFARGLRGKPTQTIGILWSFAGPHRADGVIRNFTRKALESNYLTNLFDSLSDPEVILQILGKLQNRQVDGIILQLNSEELLDYPGIRTTLQTFRASVVVSQNLGSIWRDQVDKNRNHAYLEAIRHLTRQGRKRLGYLGHNVHLKNSKAAGLRHIWEQEGQDAQYFSTLSVPSSPASNLLEAVRNALHSIDWNPKDRPEALLCSSDEMAYIAIAQLKELGLQVPQDVAIIGANNSEMAPYSSPQLASIMRSDEEAAEEAMRMLFDRLRTPDLPPQRVEIDMHFIPRESAG